MTFTVLLFASLAEHADRDQLVVELEAPTTAGELRALILSDSAMGQNLRSVRVAVNERFVEDGFVLSEGDLVALIPPVAGG